MAGWTKTLTDTTVGFDVVNIEPAKKKGYVVVSAKYPTTDTIYTYVRKANGKSAGISTTTIDGCEVQYNNGTFEVIEVTRLYDTKGLRKQTNPGGAAKQGSGTVESIKRAIEEKGLELPKVEEIEVEETKPTYKLPKGEVRHEKYETIKQCLECNIPVYLAGPAGSGKNHTVEQICKALGWEFYFSNSVQQEYKLTGFIDAGGQFHETEFYKACTSKEECVFFLDEMDASIPEVLVLLNAAIANGYFEFPSGRVTLEHVHFVAAGNTVGSGADEMYTGRMVLDQATLDRFAIIEFDYSLVIEMAISKGNDELVGFIHQLRAVSESRGIRATFSYRCITMVTKLEKAGMDIEAIIKIAVVKGLDKDTIRTLRCEGSSKYHTALTSLQQTA